LAGGFKLDGLKGLVNIDVQGEFTESYLKGSVTGTLFSASVATINGSAYINWEGDGSIVLKGSANLANGFVKAGMTLSTDLKFSKAVASGYASINIKGNSISGEYLLQYTNNNVSSDDFVAGWGEVTLDAGIFDVSFFGGIKYYFNGKTEFFGRNEVPILSSWWIDESIKDLSVEIDWQNEVAGLIETRVLVYADKEKTILERVITQAEYEENGIFDLKDWASTTSRTIFITSLESNKLWDVELVSDYDYGEVEYTATTSLKDYSLTLNEFSYSEGLLTVDYETKNLNSSELSEPPADSYDPMLSETAPDIPDEQVYFYADEDDSGFDGIYLGVGGIDDSFSTLSLDYGTYFVYGIMTGDNLIPLKEYFEGTFTKALPISAITIDTDDLISIWDQGTFTLQGSMAKGANVSINSDYLDASIKITDPLRGGAWDSGIEISPELLVNNNGSVTYEIDTSLGDKPAPQTLSKTISLDYDPSLYKSIVGNSEADSVLAIDGVSQIIGGADLKTNLSIDTDSIFNSGLLIFSIEDVSNQVNWDVFNASGQMLGRGADIGGTINIEGVTYFATTLNYLSKQPDDAILQLSNLAAASTLESTSFQAPSSDADYGTIASFIEGEKIDKDDFKSITKLSGTSAANSFVYLTITLSNSSSQTVSDSLLVDGTAVDTGTTSGDEADAIDAQSKSVHEFIVCTDNEGGWTWDLFGSLLRDNPNYNEVTVTSCTLDVSGQVLGATEVSYQIDLSDPLESTDTIPDGSGTDTIPDGSGTDTIPDGSGTDTIPDGSGTDTIPDGSGTDTIPDGSGTDTIPDGSGTDTIPDGSGTDTIPDGSGTDTIPDGSGTDTVLDGSGTDTIPNGSGKVYHWSKHEIFTDTDRSGLIPHRELDEIDQGRVVSAADALAALKLAVGINPNEDSVEVSPYQFLAADVNEDGRVSAADALNILKMAVGLSGAYEREWKFVTEDTVLWDFEKSHSKVDRSNVPWEQINTNLDSIDAGDNLVGYLVGDVNASWGGNENADHLSMSHFSDLNANGVASLEQWWLV
jgi:hypothetical protein